MAVGKPLQLDSATLNHTRPSCARVKVEIDLLGELPEEIDIVEVDEDTGKRRSKCIKIVYDYLPRYCSHCSLQGHYDSECRALHPELVEKNVEQLGHTDNDSVQPSKVLSSGKVVGEAIQQAKHVFPSKVLTSGKSVGAGPSNMNNDKLTRVNGGAPTRKQNFRGWQNPNNKRKAQQQTNDGINVNINSFQALQVEEEAFQCSEQGTGGKSNNGDKVFVTDQSNACQGVEGADIKAAGYDCQGINKYSKEVRDTNKENLCHVEAQLCPVEASHDARLESELIGKAAQETNGKSESNAAHDAHTNAACGKQSWKMLSAHDPTAKVAYFNTGNKAEALSENVVNGSPQVKDINGKGVDLNDYACDASIKTSVWAAEAFKSHPKNQEVEPQSKRLPADDELIKQMDLFDIKGFLARRNFGNMPLNDDDSEDDEIDDESMAHNFTMVARMGELSPMDARRMEKQHIEPTRVQPVRSTKSKYKR